MLLAIALLFLLSLGQGVTVPLLPALSQSGASDARLLGFVYGSHAAARILTQPFGGVWVDRVGGRRVLVIAALLYFVSLVGFFFTTSPLFTLVLRVLSGIAGGLGHPAVFVLAMHGVPPERQGRRVSTVLGIGASGMVIGPVLAALFATKDLRLPLTIAIVPTALVSVLLIVEALRTKDPGTKTQDASAAEPPRTLGEELREMRSLFLRGALFAMVLPIAFNKLTFGAFQALLPVYGEEHLSIGHRGVSLLFLATGVSFAATQSVAGRLVDRVSPRSVCLVLSVVLLIDLLSMSLFRGERTVFFVSYILYIVVSSIIFVATLKLVTTTFGEGGKRHGGLYGSVATLTDPFTVLGPILFMNVYSSIKTQTFATMAAIGILSALLFARYTSASMRSTRAKA
jgi:MFS family permease